MSADVRENTSFLQSSLEQNRSVLAKSGITVRIDMLQRLADQQPQQPLGHQSMSAADELLVSRPLLSKIPSLITLAIQEFRDEFQSEDFYDTATLPSSIVVVASGALLSSGLPGVPEHVKVLQRIRATQSYYGAPWYSYAVLDLSSIRRIGRGAPRINDFVHVKIHALFRAKIMNRDCELALVEHFEEARNQTDTLSSYGCKVFVRSPAQSVQFRVVPINLLRHSVFMVSDWGVGSDRMRFNAFKWQRHVLGFDILGEIGDGEGESVQAISGGDTGNS